MKKIFILTNDMNGGGAEWVHIDLNLFHYTASLYKNDKEELLTAAEHARHCKMEDLGF